MKILVVGSGGREHAFIRTLSRTSERPLKLFCAPGNAGISLSAKTVAIDACDIDELKRFVESELIDLTIVGGEAPLAAGLVDVFEAAGLLVAGPPRRAAQLESSKVFAKEFMARHQVPTARYRIARSAEEAIRILRSGEFGSEHSPVVVKADGLAAGKGVVVAKDRAEAEKAVHDILEEGMVGAAGNALVIEEALAGKEASLLLFTDGQSFEVMPPARDHKRIGEGDTGPNTGGMGAITAPDIMEPALIDQAIRQIVEPTLSGILAEGLRFRGILFIGLMLTPEGLQVLEYNVRSGDPETQAIMVRLESDLSRVFESIALGRLSSELVKWSPLSSASVVLAAGGYPGKPRTGSVITGLDASGGISGVDVFHAGTARSNNGEWLTAGGRVLGVTSSGATLDQALESCYSAIEKISWEGMQFRRDIGHFGGDSAAAG
jgi:phosphoribosylamine--glycine ligase